MSQKERIAELLLKHKIVTLRMLFDAGVGYTARNRISELKREGWVIFHEFYNSDKGEIVSDNKYVLISAPRSEQSQHESEASGQLLLPAL